METSRKPRSISLESSNLSLTVFINRCNQDSARLCKKRFFSAIAIFLDSESYRHIGAETIKINLNTIVNRFRSLLEANNCEIEKLHSEFETVFDRVNLFLPNVSPSKVWPNLFTKQKDLNIENIIHVAEICIAVPSSNAETERVFSFLYGKYLPKSDNH